MKDFWKSDFWKTAGVGIILAVIAAVVLIGSLIMRSSWNKEINARYAALENVEEEDEIPEETISEEETEEEVADVEISEEDIVTEEPVEEGSYAPAVSAVSDSRHEKDDGIISEIMMAALTWRGYDGYADAWNGMVSAHPEVESFSQFITDFFPDPERVRLTDENGNEIVTYIDDTYNSQFVSMDSYVTGIDEDTSAVSYVALVTSQSAGTVGGTASSHSLWIYTMGFDGTVRALEAYVTGS